MIGIYDYSVELDDPRPMNHGNIISIFAYMLHRSLKENEINEFLDVVGPDFLNKVCIPEYDKFKLINEAGLPQLVADWGEYKVIFTSSIDTDGFNFSLYYAENRVKPSDDKKFGFNQSTDDKEDSDGDCHTLYREPIYLSPYYPHYWYQMYDYQTNYRHKGHPHGFWNQYCKPIKPVVDDCGCVHYMIELDNEDGTTTDTEIKFLPSTTPMEVVWTEKISHDTLVNEIEIYQE